MPSVDAARSANLTRNFSYRPTAVVVGGTSGIGEGTARALAKTTNGNIHIIIVGRNQSSADRIFATFPQHAQSLYEFVQCDAKLMKNVKKAADTIKTKITTLNYLVTTQGNIDLGGFDPTEEGIDSKIALAFYSRWKFLDELMPALEAAKKQGQDARFLTVLAAGNGSPIDTNNLGFKKSFSVSLGFTQGPTYHDLMIDEYSRRHPGMSFTHIYPGWVSTGISQSLPWFIRPAGKIMAWYNNAIPFDDAGEIMTYVLTAPEFAQGGFWLRERADAVEKSKIHLDDEARQKLVAHYNEEVNV